MRVYHETPGDLGLTKIWEYLYQGCYEDAMDLIQSNPEGIEFVLNCTPDPMEFPKGKQINTANIDINDGHEIPLEDITRGIKIITSYILARKKVLVNCHAGISRSTSFIAAYMAMCGFGNFDQCVDFIRQRRPIVQPHPRVANSMKQFLKEWPYNDSRFERK